MQQDSVDLLHEPRGRAGGRAMEELAAAEISVEITTPERLATLEREWRDLVGRALAANAFLEPAVIAAASRRQGGRPAALSPTAQRLRRRQAPPNRVNESARTRSADIVTAGGGLARASDVERLRSVRVPRWLSTPGMSASKLACFYADPHKRAVDLSSCRAAFALKARSLADGPLGRARGYWRFLGRMAKGALRRVLLHLRAQSQQAGRLLSQRGPARAER
ncbi:hypothetical protein [Bosea sp. (in: a-proteobacteria)]|uniref:hypothetical protein n=1 Tax=Bosea sp. (in: a-proteobacteria) TaxID=1871050 RepID=UPI002FC5BD7F